MTTRTFAYRSSSFTMFLSRCHVSRLTSMMIARGLSSKTTPRITRISVYQVDLPLREGSYKFSKGTLVEVFDTSVVRVETDIGVEGWGENCPLGPAYLPAFAKGTRAGIKELGPSLIGEDPTQLLQINQVMDTAMRGHPYVKSAIDVACWDILGKIAGLPVCQLLGGRFGDSYPLYRAISQDTPERMCESVRRSRSEGYRKFQMKNGSDPDEDIERIRAVASILEKGELVMADANTGWQMHEAVRVINAIKDLRAPIYIEQPCLTYEECLSVRRMCPMPFLLDESIDSIGMIIRLFSDKAADVINLKISKVGGLTKARQIRDLCLHLGIPMNIEDTWGGDIVTTAITHLAHSTPPAFLFASTDFNSYLTVDIADGAARRVNGRIEAPTRPGLGVTPKMDVLGEPVTVIE